MKEKALTGGGLEIRFGFLKVKKSAETIVVNSNEPNPNTTGKFGCLTR